MTFVVHSAPFVPSHLRSSSNQERFDTVKADMDFLQPRTLSHDPPPRTPSRQKSVLFEWYPLCRRGLTGDNPPSDAFSLHSQVFKPTSLDWSSRSSYYSPNRCSLLRPSSHIGRHYCLRKI